MGFNDVNSESKVQKINAQLKEKKNKLAPQIKVRATEVPQGNCDSIPEVKTCDSQYSRISV